MGFEEVLVGYAALDKPDALLLDKLPYQNMEVGNLLVGSGITMVYDEMDSLRVPNLLNTHLTEDLDRQGPSTILGHRHIRRQNSDLARMMDLFTSISLNTDYLLGKRQ